MQAESTRAKLQSQVVPSTEEVCPKIIETNVINNELNQGTSSMRTKSMINCSRPVPLTGVDQKSYGPEQKLLNDEPLIGSN